MLNLNKYLLYNNYTNIIKKIIIFKKYAILEYFHTIKIF